MGFFRTYNIGRKGNIYRFDYKMCVFIADDYSECVIMLDPIKLIGDFIWEPVSEGVFRAALKTAFSIMRTHLERTVFSESTARFDNRTAYGGSVDQYLEFERKVEAIRFDAVTSEVMMDAP